MTALRTRVGRPKEILWSVAISMLAGIGAYVVTYHALIFAFRPADTAWVSPAAAAVARAAPEPSCPTTDHRVHHAHDQSGSRAPACAPVQG
jgi:hypothetical protein